MKMFHTSLIVGLATILLVNASVFTNALPLQLHTNGFVNGLAKYQLFALLVAILVTVATLCSNPSSKQFLSIGTLITTATKEKWLGINGKSSWKANGFQLLLFISLATGIFMFLAVKYTNSTNNFEWRFIPLILLFSFSNSLAEELIFRFGVIGGLYNTYPKRSIFIISAILFGLPHYFGWPSGFTGVVMASTLGYILCKSTLETKGLLIAWVIHFVQDVIIFTALLMMNLKT
jgi:uncharacterized protein